MASLEADGFGESLFEGMVLFSPSDLSSSLPSDPPPPPSPKAAPPLPAAAPPSPTAAPPAIVPAPPPPLSPTTSQPLDEDLFSDLTVQTQTLIQPPDPPPSTAPPPSAAHPSRQFSRRKKRAVRIGYGRDSNAFDPDDPLPIHDDANPNPNSPHPGPIRPPSPSELAEPSPQETEQTENWSSNIVLDDVLTVVALEKEDITVAASEKEDVTVAAPEKEDAFGSIEAKLELVKARISEKLERIQETAASLSFERKELFRRRRKATEDVGLATTRHVELERELEEACEAEDFEKAERVSDGLAAAEREKDGLLGALRNVEMECDATDLKLLEVLELHIAAEEEGAAMLEQFAKDATDHADLVLQNAEEISVKELEEWQSSMELLEMEKLQMGIESQLVFETRSGLEHSIEHLVEDERKASDELTRKRVTLAKELDELLQLVRLKEAEIVENDSKIQAVEKRISDVFSEFNETRSDIDMKHEKLQSALSKIESESEALAMKKREMDEFIFRAREKRSKLVELANTHLDDARTYRNLVGLRMSLASSVLKSREDKVRLAETEEKILGDIQILKQDISTGRITLQELSSTRASIQQEIASIKQVVGFIDKRGPELEAEKKVAAAARNFKEAGRVAAEARALGLEKDSLQNKLEKAASDLENLEEEIKGTLSNIQESEGLISLKEKDAAMTACMRLQLVATAARAERSAALESGDIEEGDILLKEAEAAESKAKELQGEYDLELEEHEKTHEHLVSIALITNLAGQSFEMASSFSVPSASDS